MSAATNYLENELMDALFRGRSYTFPTQLWLALHTADPTETGAVAEVSTTDTGYARTQYDPGYLNWLGTGGETTNADSAGTGGQVENRNDIQFADPSGGTNWGTCSHFSLCDAASGGNHLVKGVLQVSRTINQGDLGPHFAAGDLKVALA